MPIPNPGSLEAIEHGCICPRMDNRNGLGVYEVNGKPVFWYSSDCPVHMRAVNVAIDNEHFTQLNKDIKKIREKVKETEESIAMGARRSKHRFRL